MLCRRAMPSSHSRAPSSHMVRIVASSSRFCLTSVRYALPDQLDHCSVIGDYSPVELLHARDDRSAGRESPCRSRRVPARTSGGSGEQGTQDKSLSAGPCSCPCAETGRRYDRGVHHVCGADGRHRCLCHGRYWRCSPRGREEYVQTDAAASPHSLTDLAGMDISADLIELGRTVGLKCLLVGAV